MANAAKLVNKTFPLLNPEVAPFWTRSSLTTWRFRFQRLSYLRVCLYVILPRVQKSSLYVAVEKVAKSSSSLGPSTPGFRHVSLMRRLTLPQPFAGHGGTPTFLHGMPISLHAEPTTRSLAVRCCVQWAVGGSTSFH